MANTTLLHKQEKFSDYQTAVEELTQQLEHISAEKDALAADKAMLESCLQLSYQKGLTGSSSSQASELEPTSAEAYQVCALHSYLKWLPGCSAQ